MNLKPYKHLNKRVENTSTGCLGTLVEATREEGAKVWDIGIKWDCKENIDRYWDTTNVWRYNRIIPDDYVPDHGPISQRIDAIILRLKDWAFPYRLNHITEVREGKDLITLSRSRRDLQYCLNVLLWAGQGNWQTTGNTVQEAVDKMRNVLEKAKKETSEQ